MTSFRSTVSSYFHLAFSVWWFIFRCNAYNTFLYVLPSKANIKNAKNAPPYLHCWTSLHVGCKCFTQHKCVCRVLSFMCDCAQLLSILTLMCQLTRIKKLSSTPPAFLTLGWHLSDVDAVMDWRWTLDPGGPRAGFVKVPLPRSEITYPVTTQITLQWELVLRLLVSIAVKRILQGKTNFLHPCYLENQILTFLTLSDRKSVV